MRGTKAVGKVKEKNEMEEFMEEASDSLAGDDKVSDKKYDRPIPGEETLSRGDWVKYYRSMSGGSGLVKFENINIEGFEIKDKHLSESAAKRAIKFNVSTAEEANKLVQDALKNGKVVDIIPNGIGSKGQKSFSTIIDTGELVGTKGEMHIKIVHDELNNVWTTYPVPTL